MNTSYVPAGESSRLITLSGSEVISHHFILDKAGSSYIGEYLVSAQGDEKPELHIVVEHRAPHTTAEIIIKTLAEGSAAPRCTGLLKIAPGCSGASSHLTYHSLLFDDAQSYTVPALEIEHHEVKCSHAATVHAITDTDILYLQARGIPEEHARNLLKEAFLTPSHAELAKASVSNL